MHFDDDETFTACKCYINIEIFALIRGVPPEIIMDGMGIGTVTHGGHYNDPIIISYCFLFPLSYR